MTGGGEWDPVSSVSVYSESGWVSDLAAMNQKRSQHGCTAFISGGKKVKGSLIFIKIRTLESLCLDLCFSQVFMVTGGYDGSDYIGSTEMYGDWNDWKTLPASGNLPDGVGGLKLITIASRVLLFGKCF